MESILSDLLSVIGIHLTEEQERSFKNRCLFLKTGMGTGLIISGAWKLVGSKLTNYLDRIITRLNQVSDKRLKVINDKTGEVID